MRTRQFTRTAVALAAAVLLVACAPGGDPVDPVDPEQAERDERIAEVLAARAALAETVPAVVEAAEGYVTGLRGVRDTQVATSAERAAAGAALPTTPLDTAQQQLEAAELEGEGPDVQAARSAVEELLEVVGDVRAGVDDEVEELGELAAFDAALAEVVEAWDRPGSRTEQREALGDAAARAEELAAQAGAAEPIVPCLDVWTHREQAATTVAERSAQLRDLVAGSTGTQFDEARDEWRGDPTGLGTPPAELDADAMDCWDEGSPARTAADRLRVLADEVGAALSPDDLTG